MKEIKPRSACPISFTLDFLGDKWSLLVLRDMMLEHKTTYSEFLQSDEGIATNILADRLSMLEMNGFVTKQVASDKKSKFVYTLTDKAIRLVPVIMEIGLWGSEFHPSEAKQQELTESFRKDKLKTIDHIQNEIRNKRDALAPQ
jgi:DNA-binding HxlR family transcriptional regulator